MGMMRNKEIRRALFLQAALAAAGTALAAGMDRRFGMVALALCALYTIIYLAETRARYGRIAALSQSLDGILHGRECVLRESCEEGELSILESEVAKMTIRLREQSARLEEDKAYLADLAADISHQIRTPLTSASLLATLLQDEGLSDGRRMELSHELLDLLSRIDSLVTAQLKLSRLDAGAVELKKETIPLERLARECSAPLLIPMELHGQSLIIDAEGSFTGDESWTSEALGNIAKNCMEHAGPGGSVSIKARENALYSEILLSDDGDGIAEEDLPHVFERFYKGSGSDGKNFGIGLALSRTVITAQGGTVKAENLPGGGALFTVRFYKGTV